MTDIAEDVSTEPQDELIPVDPTRQVQLEDVYAVLVDMHRMEARKMQILESLATLVNQAGEQIPDLVSQLQESPIFGMLSGNGGGILGGLFRR